MNHLDHALALTRHELEAMPLGSLAAVAQALGTSGKAYDGRASMIRRIQSQQQAHMRPEISTNIAQPLGSLSQPGPLPSS